jgi:hypothetical protein
MVENHLFAKNRILQKALAHFLRSQHYNVLMNETSLHFAQTQT